MIRCCVLLLLVGLPAAAGLDLAAASPAEVQETVTTVPVADDGLLYVASSEFPDRVGHLRALSLAGGPSVRLWDAADRMPPPGAALPPPADPGLAALAPQFDGPSGQRQVFTGLPVAGAFRLVAFEARAAHQLAPLLGAATPAAAAALINAVRGRSQTSAANPAGSGDRPNRLGAISRSSPALAGGSLLAAGGRGRDQVLYVGAEDGLLHAILAGRRTADGYDHAAPECGGELWAYLPGSLLPYLSGQPFDRPGDAPAVHVDGAPAVDDLFFDSDGDGRREWRTVLVGTATIERLNRGVIFALDVTDPRAPRLLWETTLPALAPGRSRGAALGWSGGWTDPAPRVYVTFATAGRIDLAGSVDAGGGRHGVLACALDPADGRLLWRFASPYPEAAADRVAPPSLPSLVTGTDGATDAVVFGDLAGRLWVLDPVTGRARGGGPLWQAPGGAREPIGPGLAVRDRLVLLGTGGVDDSAGEYGYAVYAVEVTGDEARLRWIQLLAPGERLWGAPLFDRFGQAVVGVGRGAAGRLLTVTADGALAASVPLAGTPSGGAVATSGALVAVSLQGRVEMFGTLSPDPAEEAASPGRVRVLSWRVR